jgi:putative ABC transport system permease protein
MKFIPLVWAMLWRKKTRTLLTIFSIVIAFLLFGILQGVNSAFKEVVERSNVNKLLVANSASFLVSLPYADMAQIESVPGVEKVAHETWFGSYFQDPRNAIAAIPVEADRMLNVSPEIKIPKEQIAAMHVTRDGAILGRQLATKFGWKINDRVSLHSTIWIKGDGSSDWSFNVVGIFEAPTDRNQEQAMYFNYKYFDEARVSEKGTVGWYVVLVNDPTRSAQISAAIDKLFSNSSFETKTQSEKEFQQSFLKQVADISLIVTYILVAVFFSLLFASGSTMLQSVRERTPELAVLKTLGFSDSAVLSLVLCESVTLCVFSASLGLACALALFPAFKDSIGVVKMPPVVILEGILLAALMAFTIGIIPAWRAKRLVIVEALRS